MKNNGERTNWFGGRPTLRFEAATMEEMNKMSPSLFKDGDICFVPGEGSYTRNGAEWANQAKNIVKGFAILPEEWSLTGFYDDYPWQADIPIDGVTPADFTQIDFYGESTAIALKAMIRPSSTELAGALRVYAKAQPLDTLHGKYYVAKGEA